MRHPIPTLAPPQQDTPHPVGPNPSPNPSPNPLLPPKPVQSNDSQRQNSGHAPSTPSSQQQHTPAYSAAALADQMQPLVTPWPKGGVVAAQPRQQGPGSGGSGGSRQASAGTTSADGGEGRSTPPPLPSGLGQQHWQAVPTTTQAEFQLHLTNGSATSTTRKISVQLGAEDNQHLFVMFGNAGRGFSDETLDSGLFQRNPDPEEKKDAAEKAPRPLLARQQTEHLAVDSLTEEEELQDAMQTEFNDLEGRIWRRSNEVVGAGAYGRVFLGMDEEQGRFVAMKYLENVKHESCSEIRYLETLLHANIVQYMGTIRCKNNSVYIVMEYVATGSLAALIKKFRTLTPKTTARYARDILNGLAYLHENRIVHRDIKPQNVLVDPEGRCKLTDFGTARTDVTASKKSEASLAGTPMYISPESLKGKGGYPSDIWSLGLMLVEMLTGEHPYAKAVAAMSSPSPYAIMFHIAHHEPVIRDDICVPLALDFIRKCLLTDPEKRPTAHELLQHEWLAFT